MNNLIDLLKNSAVKHGFRKAVIYKNRVLTYRGLVREVVRLSQRLAMYNIRRGDRIAILLPNCPEFVISYFAVLNLEAVVVSLNNLLKPNELAAIVEDSESCFLITGHSFEKAAELISQKSGCVKEVLFVEDDITKALPFLKRKLKNSGLNELKSDAVTSDIALILYTSGTTGIPKGVMLEHGNLIFDVLACREGIKVTPKDNFLCMLPLFHSFPQTVCMLLPFSCGARMTIVSGIRPFSVIVKAILKRRVTVFVSVPAVYNILVNLKISKILLKLFKLFSPLRVCVSGASALPGSTLKGFQERFGIPLLEGYGLTEAAPVVSLNPLFGQRKAGSIGRPLKGVEVKVVTETGEEAGKLQVGEFVIKGPNIMKGYYNKPEETQQALKDGWLFSGDMGKIDEDGYLFIVDRKKDMINVSGLKVYPREIEELLYAHPAVKEAAVVAVKDQRHGEVPKAFVALNEGYVLSESEIIGFIRKRVANYKVPKSVSFLSSLPKTQTGKIAKRELSGYHS